MAEYDRRIDVSKRSPSPDAAVDSYVSGDDGPTMRPLPLGVGLVLVVLLAVGRYRS